MPFEFPEVEESSTLGSFIPVLGPTRDAIHHFQKGNMAAGTLYAGLAVLDIVPAWTFGKAVGRVGGLAIKSFLSKESINLMVKGSGGGTLKILAVHQAEHLSWSKLGEKSFLGKKFVLGPGVEIAEHQGVWLKRVDPQANLLKRVWGVLSLEAQEQGLKRLGEMGAEYAVKEGMLATRSVGTIMPRARNATFWKSYMKGSFRMKTLYNDIRPRNMGINGSLFDPAFDPLLKSGWQAIPYIPGHGVVYLSKKYNIPLDELIMLIIDSEGQK